MPDNFKDNLEKFFKKFFEVVSTNDGSWTVKGFIDIYKNIYTISVDTKVISKIIELMIFPVILKFSEECNYDMVLSSHQNHYPDITFIHKTSKEKIALDLKSTYRINDKKVNGMTLGAFTGYFRNRDSNKNIQFPYSEYSKHYVLGVIYTRTELFKAEQCLKDKGYSLPEVAKKALLNYISNSNDDNFLNFYKFLNISNDKQDEIRSLLDKCLIDERRVYKIDELYQIISVVRDFDFFLQEKWKIAIDRPGSGNTKNIGSTTSIKELKTGSALFTKFENGEEIFNDYWISYLTNDMAQNAGYYKPPYKNIKEYFIYKEGNKK